MKTKFLKRSSLLIAAFLLLLLLVTAARSEILRIITPLWQVNSHLTNGLKNFFTLLRDKDNLAKENIELREELVSYNSLLESNRALSSSRDELLVQFGRAPVSAGVAAGVLVHPPITPYDILVVDAGSSEGVREGELVSLPEGGALGKVSEVESYESKVNLFTTAGLETPAFLERGNISVVLSGSGGGGFKFSLPRDAAVEVGDKILLPGVRSELLGVVREVSVEPTDSAKQVYVSGVANIGSVRFVLIH